MQSGLKAVRTSMITILLWKNVIINVNEYKKTTQITRGNDTLTGIWINIQNLTIMTWNIVTISITRNTSVAMNAIRAIATIIVGISTVVVMLGETIMNSETTMITIIATAIIEIPTLTPGVPINTATHTGITCKRDRVRLSCALV